MGTGSHRPQWEAAKGRQDAQSGIKHARSLPSHTRLKYRRSIAPVPVPLQRSGIEAAKPGTEIEVNAVTENKNHVLNPLGSINGHQANPDSGANSNPRIEDDANVGATSAFDSGDDDSEEELRRELDLINKRRALQSQRDARQKPAPAKTSQWRSEATFKRTKPVKKRSSDMVNDPLKKAEHHEFLDKYLK